MLSSLTDRSVISTRVPVPTLLCVWLALSTFLGGCGENVGPNFPPPSTIEPSVTIEGVGYALFTPDGDRIVVAGATTPYGRTVAWLHDAGTGEMLVKYQPYPDAIRWFSSMAISRDGSRLAVAGIYRDEVTGGGSFPGIMTWELESGRIDLTSMDLPLSSNDLPHSLLFLSGIKRVVGISGERILEYDIGDVVWDTLPIRHYEGRLPPGNPHLELSPSGTKLLTIGSGPIIWSVATGTIEESFNDTRQWRHDAAAYIGSDDSLLLGESDGLSVVSIAANKASVTITEEYDEDGTSDPAVTSVAVSDNRARFAAVDDEGWLRVWESGTFRPLVVGRLSGTPEHVALTADGRKALTLSTETQTNGYVVQVWELP